MANTGQAFRMAVPYLMQLPDDQHFDTLGGDICSGVPGLQMQATTLAQAAVIRRVFPGARWAKEFRKDLGWWEYTTTLPDGLTVQIYAVTEAPPRCTPIYKKVKTIKKVPTAWEDQEVETQVLDGFDCGADDEAPAFVGPSPEAG